MKSVFGFILLATLLASCGGESKEQLSKTSNTLNTSAGEQPLAAVEYEPFLTFDFVDGKVENGFDDWFYSDKGEDPCNVWAGETRSKLCTSAGYKSFLYYNDYNNPHMGWIRYGYIDASPTVSVRGSALKIQTTGGAYQLPDDGVDYRGIEARSKSDISDFSVITSIAEEPNYLGNISFYMKGPTDTSKFEQLQGKNRFSIWVLMPTEGVDIKNFSGEYRSSTGSRVTWYPFINRGSGGHYYHRSANIPMGGWTKIQFDAHPSHHNGGVPYEYSAFSTGGNEHPGDSVSYFNNIATMALIVQASEQQSRFSEFYLDEFATSFVDFENEETINNLGVGFNPQTKVFDISFEDKYRCLVCSSMYEVKYSFSPITNANYKDAYTPSLTINFHRSKNNTEGTIYKPNRGYNLLWSALELQEAHKALLTDHKKIYFAVKDISTRDEIQQQDIDVELVNVPGVGAIRRMDLIKSIEYEIIPVPVSKEQPSAALPNSNVEDCNVIVDFKNSIEESDIKDPRFHSIETDRYTKFNALGTTISIGSNKNYDFQKVEGELFKLEVGDKVRLIWKNLSDELITFSPRISFTEPARVSSLDTSGWINATEISLAPNQTMASELEIVDEITTSFINTNVNYSHNGALVLDRIELETLSNNNLGSCETVNETTKNYVLVDFYSSITESVLPMPEFHTIFKDKYTNVVTNGIGSIKGAADGYNFQGIKGEGKEFKNGDVIRMTWLNTSQTDVTFTPKLSFKIEGRYHSDSEQDWLELDTVSVDALGKQTSDLIITDDMAGHIDLINISNNTDINLTLLLDKLEVLTSSY